MDGIIVLWRDGSRDRSRPLFFFFIVKYASLWGFCRRRRRSCLGSLIPY